jgi:hypothetical protein
MKLHYGTRVRITAKDNYYCGKIGLINDDNSFDIWLAQQTIEAGVFAIAPDYRYNIDVPTPDGEDIEHTSAAPGEFEVLS